MAIIVVYYRIRNQGTIREQLWVNKTLILLYGGRSEREVSEFFSRKRDACDWLLLFSFKPTLLAVRRLHPDASFEEKPADDEKLMTNETVDWSKKGSISICAGAVVFPVLMDQDGRRWFHSRLLEVLKMPYKWLWHPFPVLVMWTRSHQTGLGAGGIHKFLCK